MKCSLVVGFKAYLHSCSGIVEFLLSFLIMLELRGKQHASELSRLGSVNFNDAANVFANLHI